MMISRILAVLLVAAAPAAAAAQGFGPSIDASAGVFAGDGGAFLRRGGPAIDGVLAVPLGRAAGGTLVAGVTAGISGSMGGDLICEPDPHGACKADYPTFASVGAVAGVQRRLGSGLSARALAGPAYYQAVDGPDALGVQGRIDVAKPLFSRLALVGSLRAALLPEYEGESLRFAAVGVGLRIQ
jgi:hypothetical protein